MPTGDIDFGDLGALGYSSELGDFGIGDFGFGDFGAVSEFEGLFSINPSERDTSDLVQVAGDVPETPNNQGQLPEPPEIPPEKPKFGGDYMRFLRAGASWIKAVGRFAPYVDIFLGGVQQLDETGALAQSMMSANDPPRTLEELQDRVSAERERGYQDHHIVEEKAARAAGFPEELIQGRDNLVRIPVTKHIDLTADYARKTN